MASDILSKYVIPGSKVDIRPVRSRNMTNEEQEPRTYTTQIYDILSEDRLEILMPMEKTKLVLLPVGGEYYLYFYSENGLYQGKAKVVDRYKRGATYILAFDLISNLRKEQRREYYRFSCALEMNTRVLEEDEIVALEQKGVKDELLVPGIPLKRSVIVDISGGGLRFVANYSYDAGSIILCKYQLETEEGPKIYEVLGKVLNVRENINRPGVFEHRVQYINIEDEEREEIIKFIFEEERKNLKKKGPI